MYHPVMPYIKPSSRVFLDMQTELLDPAIKTAGDLNYAITRLALRFIQREKLSYDTLARVIGTLRLATAEMEQRLVRPYEDSKIATNGDVYEYQNLLKDINQNI